jgi:hypothetical protein
VIYKDASDPDYQSMRDLVTAAARKAWANPRRDLQALVDQRLAASPSHVP